MFTVWPKSCLYNGFDRGCDAYMDRDLILEPWYLPRSSSDVIPISPFTTRFVWYPHQPWVYVLYWLAILNVVILLAYLHQGVGVCLCKDHNKKVFICTEFFHLQGKTSFICFKTENYGKRGQVQFLWTLWWKTVNLENCSPSQILNIWAILLSAYWHCLEDEEHPLTWSLHQHNHGHHLPR